MNMSEKAKYKLKIKNALLNKQDQISVDYYNAVELFKEVLEENPLIAVTIEKMRYVGLFTEETFLIKYANSTKENLSVFYADTEEEIENILHNALKKYDIEVVISADSNLSIGDIYNRFIIKYHGFYSNLISMECEKRDIFGGKRIIVKFLFKYRIGRVKLNIMETALNDEIKRLENSLFCDGMSKQVRAFVAFNYLTKEVSYWQKDFATPLEKSYMHSAYGALINKKCVCQGYAEAYKRILNSQDIICEVICGKIKGSPEHHAWNVISFNGKDYYHVDVTWGVAKNRAKRYIYYGMKDADIIADRLWTRDSKIVCNGEEDILNIARRELAKDWVSFMKLGVNKKYFN